MDAVELKKIFGRGQGYGKWGKSTLDENLKQLQSLGFKIIFAESFHCFEYYPSYKELDLFLQGVPIFEDFDSKKDKSKLEIYISKFQTAKGIKLSRHRIVLVAQK